MIVLLLLTIGVLAVVSAGFLPVGWALVFALVLVLVAFIAAGRHGMSESYRLTRRLIVIIAAAAILVVTVRLVYAYFTDSQALFRELDVWFHGLSSWLKFSLGVLVGVSMSRAVRFAKLAKRPRNTGLSDQDSSPLSQKIE